MNRPMHLQNSSRILRHITLVAALLCHSPLSSAAQADETPDLNEALSVVKWRSIGPFRGGRSVCASGVINNSQTYFMGTTGGGLWKSDDAGQIWNNVSDGFFGTGSVGAIAVSETNPQIVYVGMGEHAPRGVMTSHGDGVYKSTNGGKTWQHLGLAQTQHISRIVLHPADPDIVFVAAQGALYGPTQQRGIFKSTDGGQSWTRVLFVNDKTGCSELAIDRSNPRVLYAAMWEHQRKPWKIISGGPGSGIYKSTDAGETWNPIEEGLPDEKGKTAVAVSRSNPDRIYALVEGDSNQEKGGLFVSENGGETWDVRSRDHRLVQRAWYYTEVFVDPNDDRTVYVLSASALRSIDGGKSWETLSGTHGDFHDLWINPNDSRNMVIANDGGAAVSFNYGKSWSRQDNMPTAQLYRVNVDNRFPYRIYGGQQDNTSIAIATLEPGSSGISTRSWAPSAGGESAFLAFDPDNPRYVMGGSYLGTIEVLDTEAAAGSNIMSAPIQYLGRAARDMRYLFNWNAPIIRSQHEADTYYHAAQCLLQTTDRGKTWKEISPDLTRDQDNKQGKGGGPLTVEAVGAENYGTISYVAESPHEPGVLWTGSDDGLIHITRNGGRNWIDVTPADLEECLVNAIEISPHDPATAYVATTRYKFNDKHPGLYKTTDYGASWTQIVRGIPESALTRVVREDDARPGLLYAGTEAGLYLSTNSGETWTAFQLNLPMTPILDLAVRHGDLIAATSGRGFWILDDLSLIRQFDTSTDEVRLFNPEPAILSNHGSELDSTDKNFSGAHPLRGVNPANGAVLYYSLPTLESEERVELSITDPDGSPVASFSSDDDKDFQKYAGGPPSPKKLSGEAGLNRFVWDMRHKTMTGIPEAYIEGSYRGHKVKPGTYQITLTAADETRVAFVEVMPNPLYSTSPREYREYDKLMSAMERELTAMHEMTNRLHGALEQIDSLLTALPERESTSELRQSGTTLRNRLQAWDEEMVQRKSKAYDDVENFPNKFTAEYLFLINQTESDLPRITQGSRDRLAELNRRWKQLRKQGQHFIDSEIPEFNQLLWANNIGAIWASEAD